MKNNYRSLMTVFFVMAVLITIRLFYTWQALQTFQWDSLGYYMYLPAQYIYHDIAKLEWWPTISTKYHYSGNFYQANLELNGNYVFFYSIGVSLLQTPFFFIAHWLAGWFGYPQD